MTGPHTATLTFSYPTTETATIVLESIRQEEGEIEGDRTDATVSRTNETLEVRITAADLVALRAGCTTWTSLVSVAERVAIPDDR